MPAKKAAKKVSAKKKTVTKKVVEPPVAPPETQVGKMNWSNVVKTQMKKPRSWADWAARQLDENKLG